MKTAFHSFAYGGRSWLPSLGLHEMLRRVKALGFDGIELGALRPHAWPGDLRGKALREAKSLLEDLRLEVAAVNPTVVNHNLISPLPNERRDTIGYYRDCLHLAAELGAPYLTFSIGWRVQGTAMAQAKDWMLEALEQLLPEAGRCGVVIVAEAVNSNRTNFLTTTQGVLELVREIDSPCLQAMLDLYHAFLMGEDPLKSLRLLGKNLRYIHFVDGARGTSERRLPGQGDTPMDRALSTLREIGYLGYLTVEIWGADPDRLGAQAMEFFRRYGLGA